ncbi:hypothetical protein [Runella zeae]|uniref:hypothetical protein n=1 Tax=Runella zeae TaxID=94255 RepID=UPI0004200D9A|nr:hypothetical protein [Runella zeae]
MENKLRIELTAQELEQLIGDLHTSTEKSEALMDILTEKFFTSVAPEVKASLTEDSLAAEVWALITRAISILTGRPQGSIKPENRLVTLGMTSNKIEHLRIHINQFINKKGSKKFITATDMDKINTVGELHALTLTKLKP